MKIMKTCGNCIFFKQIYKRFISSYSKYNLYYCEKLCQVTDKENFCERWKQKDRTFDFSKRRFDEIEEDIKFISDYLKSNKIE